MSGEQEIEVDGPDEESPRRVDVMPATAKPRGKIGRPRKIRHDSEITAAVDGFGDPFKVRLAPGWTEFWVSAHDASRMSRRKWEQGTWGDPRILSYDGAAPGRKGQPIQDGLHGELTLYLMRTKEAERLRAQDPRRQRQEELMKNSRLRAEGSEAGGKRGYFKSTATDVTV